MLSVPQRYIARSKAIIATETLNHRKIYSLCFLCLSGNTAYSKLSICHRNAESQKDLFLCAFCASVAIYPGKCRSVNKKLPCG